MIQSSPIRNVEQFNEDGFDDDRLNSSTDVKFRRNLTDSNSHPVLHRALSTVSANQTLVNNQRNLLARNYRRTSINDEIVTIDHNDAEASFLLPNLSELPEEIRTRVMESLLDTPTMISLEETKRLNWWVEKKLPFPKLYPLLTSGDGNCLLHATSLAMWGFHDHSLSMRKALNETLITSKPNNALYRRWRWSQSVQNKKYGLVFSEQEWDEEWKSLLRLSSVEPRISQTKSSNSSETIPVVDETSPAKSAVSGGSSKSSCQSTRQYYESLEEFHVYVLANNIRRPIVIYSDTILRTNDGEAISPIDFGGIYLPLEIPPDKCHRQPIFLAFDAAHFSALVPMENNSKSPTKASFQIPLIDIDTTDLLPIHFLIDPGVDFSWPIDEELSDEKMQTYTNSPETRLKTLEKYLNLSKESFNVNLRSTTNLSHDESIVSNEITSSPTNNQESNVEINTSSAISSVPKKSSRSSLNSFSKIIRRTLIHPFSSAKRFSLKHHHSVQIQSQNVAQVSNIEHSESNLNLENSLMRRKSSPLLNHSTDTLTIIVANFQPKRPKTSDNMIKNYIDACLSDYQLEKMKMQLNEMTPIDIENSQSTKNHVGKNEKSNENYPDWQEYAANTQPSQTQQRSTKISQMETNSAKSDPASPNAKKIDSARLRRQLPPLPNEFYSNKDSRPDRFTQNNCEIDESEAWSHVERQASTDTVDSIQIYQKQHTPLTQSASLDVTNGVSLHINGRPVENPSSTNQSSNKDFQNSLKQQQSVNSDQTSPKTIRQDFNATDYQKIPIKTTINNINRRTQQINGITNGYSRSQNHDFSRRF